MAGLQPIHRMGRAVAVIGLVIWILGSIWSLTAGDFQTFQRFGSVGVAAAVLFFTDRLTKIELSRQRSVERLLHEYGVELQAIKSGVDPAGIPSTGFVIDFLTEERKFDKLRMNAEWLGTLNIFLLTLSTLQWGFGDTLLIRYFATEVPL